MAYEAVPEELKSSARWGLSTTGLPTALRESYPAKAPMRVAYAVSGEPFAEALSSTAPSRWMKFKSALKSAEVHGGCLGIFLGPIGDGLDDLIGGDIDLYKCDDSATRDWLLHMISICPGYVETSPSGEGYRFLVRGSIAASRKSRVVEVYDRSRFLRMTGVDARGSLDGDAATWLSQMMAYLGPQTEARPSEQFRGEFVAAVDARRRFGEILEQLPQHERENIRRIDQHGAGDSDDAMVIVTALLRVEADAGVVFTILCAIKSIQRHYRQKHGSDWPRHVERKFRADWYPKGLVHARRAVAEQERLNSVLPLIDKLVECSKAKKLAADASIVAAAKGQWETMDHAPEDDVYAPQREFPVPILNEMVEAIGKTTLDTEYSLAEASTLSIAALLVSRRVATPTDCLCAIQQIVLGNSSSGKEVLSSGLDAILKFFPEEAKARYGPFNVRSTIALHQQLELRKVVMIVQDEIQDVLPHWFSQSGSWSGMTTLFKNSYSKNRVNGYIPAEIYSLNNREAKPIAGIDHPALNLVGCAQPAEYAAAFSKFTTTDGFVGRPIHRRATKDYRWDELDRPEAIPPHIAEKCLEIYHWAFSSQLPANDATLWYARSTFTPAAAKMDRELNARTRALKRDEHNQTYQFWRSVRQNTLKVATVLATWRNHNEILITAKDYGWAQAYVEQGADLLCDMYMDGTFSGVTDSSLGRVLAKWIVAYLGGSGGTALTQKLRADKIFNKGVLGRPPVGISRVQGVPEGIAFKRAIDHLKGREAIEELARDGQKPRYTLGSMWNEYCSENGIERFR